MKYRNFGSMDWQVSELGLGTYPFSTNWGNLVEENEAARIVVRALELGVNFIDTADVYGYGRAETILGKVLVELTKREKTYLATKGGRDFTSKSGQVLRNFESDYLRGALIESLKRLQTDHVDLYQLHGPEIKVIEKGEIFEFLHQVKEEGLARAVGVSVNSLDEIYFIARRYPIDAVGFPFNFLSSYRIEEALDFCLEKNIAVILREPLAQGLLTGKYRAESRFEPTDFRSDKFDQERLKKAEAVVKRLRSLSGGKMTPAQMALRYVLSHAPATTVIFGAKSVLQLEEDLHSTNLEPDRGQIDSLEMIRDELVLG